MQTSVVRSSRTICKGPAQCAVRSTQCTTSFLRSAMYGFGIVDFGKPARLDRLVWRLRFWVRYDSKVKVTFTSELDRNLETIELDGLLNLKRLINSGSTLTQLDSKPAQKPLNLNLKHNWTIQHNNFWVCWKNNLTITGDVMWNIHGTYWFGTISLLNPVIFNIFAIQTYLKV